MSGGHFGRYIIRNTEVEIEAVGEATVVLLCVPSVAMESAAAALWPQISDGALLFTLQNGVDNFFFQAEDGIRDPLVTGVQTCALPISRHVGAHRQLEGGNRPGLRQPARDRLAHVRERARLDVAGRSRNRPK